MPYSSDSGKAFIDRAIRKIRANMSGIFWANKAILDLGTGSGTYSDRFSKTLLPRSEFWWMGVEIWEPYVKEFDLDAKYDQLFVEDARDFVRSDMYKFDICFIGDLIEHMSKEDAIELVMRASQIANLVIISIPIVHYPQGEYKGNPYEAHVKDDWSHEEVLEICDPFTWATDGEIGIYMIANEELGINRWFLKSSLDIGIAVYGICKNEINFIDRCIDSIQEADYITFCDTGSTDGTWERLVQMAQAKDNMAVQKICVDPWRFDDARNTALSLIPDTIDVCISIDADEMMHYNWYDNLYGELRNELMTTGKLEKRYNHRFETHWNWDKPNEEPIRSEHWHERIHPRAGYRWKLPVHEILVTDGVEKLEYLENVKMIQHPDNSKSRGSYLQLLEISIKEDPTVWKSWYFYAEALFQAGESLKAIDTLAKIVTEIDTADIPYVRNRMAHAFEEIDRYDLAIREMNFVIWSCPHIREYLVHRAKIFFAAGQETKGVNDLVEATSIVQRTYGYEYDPSCWNHQFDNLLKEHNVTIQ
jgi:glycosyltransferase involved in cell wall biosynthesis